MATNADSNQANKASSPAGRAAGTASRNDPGANRGTTGERSSADRNQANKATTAQGRENVSSSGGKNSPEGGQTESQTIGKQLQTAAGTFLNSMKQVVPTTFRGALETLAGVATGVPGTSWGLHQLLEPMLGYPNDQRRVPIDARTPGLSPQQIADMSNKANPNLGKVTAADVVKAQATGGPIRAVGEEARFPGKPSESYLNSKKQTPAGKNATGVDTANNPGAGNANYRASDTRDSGKPRQSQGSDAISTAARTGVQAPAGATPAKFVPDFFLNNPIPDPSTLANPGLPVLPQGDLHNEIHQAMVAAALQMQAGGANGMSNAASDPHAALLASLQGLT